MYVPVTEIGLVSEDTTVETIDLSTEVTSGEVARTVVVRAVADNVAAARTLRT